MAFIQRRLLRLVILVVNHPVITLGVAGVVLACCVALAMARLSISTDENQLFSPRVKFFRDFLEFDRKFPENDALYVIVEAADPSHPPAVDRWTALADRITERLQHMPKYVESVDSRVPLEQLGAQSLLFEDSSRLAQRVSELQRFAPLMRLVGESPSGLGRLLGATPIDRLMTAAAPPSDRERLQFVGLLADSWTRTIRNPGQPPRLGTEVPDLSKLDADDPSQLGYYYVPSQAPGEAGRHLLLVRVYDRENFSSLTSLSETVDAIRASVAEAAKPFPEFRVAATGRPAINADEMRTTDTDTNRAEVVAMIVIFMGLMITLRSFRLALAAEIALAVAIGWTFGYATLAVGHLNLLSLVFLIALIGIGMDYLIQVLASYRREARRYVRADAVWTRVFRRVGPPVLTAGLGASGAFLVSVFTEFRGAAELGIIAGGGLILCLVSAYTVLPALLTLFPPVMTSVNPAARFGTPDTRPPATRRRALLLPALWGALLLAGIPFIGRASFNPNLLDLQAPNLESVQLVKKLQTWSAVVISPDLELLRRVRQGLEGAPTVSTTESLLNAQDNYAWLRRHSSEMPRVNWALPAPVTAPALSGVATRASTVAEALERLGGNTADAARAARSLRDFSKTIQLLDAAAAAQAAGQLSQWQELFVDELKGQLAPFNPPPLNVAALPAELRSHFLSAEGDYALYINPKEDLWKREPLERFVNDIESRVSRVSGAPAPTGLPPELYHTTTAIESSLYKAVAYALGLVLLLVMIDLRNLRQTLLAVGVLALGLPMLVALMGLFRVSWNFANFFAVPILIGAGHEYGVFMIHRYKEARHNPRRVWRAWDVSDRALFLCAFVTTSSFAFFWALGHHRGLRSLGLVMALGSACIYLASLLVIRPLLIWRLSKERQSLNAEIAESAETRPTQMSG